SNRRTRPAEILGSGLQQRLGEGAKSGYVTGLPVKPTLYLETTVPSYLTAWPSRDLIRAGHQQITKEWWRTRRAEFDIYISQFVLDEAAAGDAEAARERMAALQGLPLLDLTDEVVDLAAALKTSLALPEKAVTDAVHIAIAA